MKTHLETLSMFARAAHGYNYYKVFLPLSRRASSQNIRLKLTPQGERKWSKLKLQILCSLGLLATESQGVCCPWNSSVNVLKNLQLSVQWEQILIGRIQWNMKRLRIQSRARFSRPKMARRGEELVILLTDVKRGFPFLQAKISADHQGVLWLPPPHPMVLIYS